MINYYISPKKRGDRLTINDVKVVVRGGGDLASGVSYRLSQAGFPVIVTEIQEPLSVRRTVSFAEAVYAKQIKIEDLIGVLVNDFSAAVEMALQPGTIPVLVDPIGEIIRYWKPVVVIDGIMAKKNIAQTSIQDAPLVIGLGPGFRAGQDAHAIVETKRGHFLGRVFYTGQALPNTGIPGIVNGIGRQRVIYSKFAGVFSSQREIGDWIEQGQVFGYVDQKPISAQITGRIRGLLKPGIRVLSGVKVGDIDPRSDADCWTISDKALAVAGGVLEIIVTSLNDQLTFS